MSHFFEAAAASTGTPSCRSHLSLPLPWPLEDGIPIRGPLFEATPSADLGMMVWCPRAYSYPMLQLHTPTHTHTLTMRCWKSQERIILVACLGKTPRLFLDFLSSFSRREVRSRLTFRARGEKISISSLAGQRLGTCCHRDSSLSLPVPFPNSF